ncbi:MAG: ATP-binding protein [Bacillota bacterium]|nr:ATP-binding protein [Bacillota bacterium]
MRKNRIILIAIIFALFILSGCSSKIIKSPKIENGILDLGKWSFDKDGIASVGSDWLRVNSPFSPSPGNGSETDNSENLIKNSKSASAPIYKLKILVSDIDKDYGIYISNYYNYYNIWINGVPKVTNADLDHKNITVGSINAIYYAQAKDGAIEIAIQSDNFKPKSILFGVSKQILDLKINRFSIDLPIVFIIVFMGFYHIIVFIFRKKEKPYLFTGFYCFASAVNASSISNDPILFFLFPKLDLNTYFAILEISAFFALFFIIFYINTLYPRFMNNKILTLAKALLIAFISIILFYYILNDWTYKIPIKAYNLLLIASSFYIIYILIKIQRKNKDALLIILGLVIMFITNMMDLYLNAQTNYSNFGWLIFISILSVRLAINFTKTFTKVEHLSEKLLIMDKLKDDFLVNTAHELKTPMHGIIGIAESMLEEADKAHSKETENLALIASSARRLTELVNNIMDFAKMKNKDIVLNIGTINLWQVVDVVFAVLRPVAKAKGLVLKNSISDDTINVYADENRLFQILYNIAGNAVKFTDSGSVTAEAEVINDIVEITISDTGIGIAENMLDTIFLPFEQVQSDENRSNSGTGLGLSITKNLVELHDGKISAQSSQTKPNNGSKFTFTLKLSKDKSQNNRFIKGASVSSNSDEFIESPDDNLESSKGLSILIADDEPINLKILQNIFKRENYSVITATNGVNALEAIENHQKPDLVILDVMMPKMSGYEVCAKLREKYEMYDLPIVLVTVKNQPADILAGFEAGANDYLTKPFNDKELKARIQNLMEVKKSINFAVAAEMNFLQAQIKPHFLYNTLNVIMSLIRTDPDKSRELLFELSSYLRESFKFKGVEKSISLKKEITMVKSYIYIMMARFPDKILPAYDIDDVDLNVPHLIIQPIVENSLKHGILTKREGGTVKLTVKDEGSHIYVCVSDDGVGIQKELIPVLLNENTKTTGIGLVNVNKRLITFYRSGLNIESEPGKGTSISFRIPKGIRI